MMAKHDTIVPKDDATRLKPPVSILSRMGEMPKASSARRYCTSNEGWKLITKREV